MGRSRSCCQNPKHDRAACQQQRARQAAPADRRPSASPASAATL